MSRITIEISGTELVDQNGAVIFTTDSQIMNQPSGLGKALTLTAHFPNTLTGGGIQTIALQVSNNGVDFIDKIVVGLDDGLEEVLNWRYIRFDYRLTGGAPTGNITRIKTELV